MVPPGHRRGLRDATGRGSTGAGGRQTPRPQPRRAFRGTPGKFPSPSLLPGQKTRPGAATPPVPRGPRSYPERGKEKKPPADDSPIPSPCPPPSAAAATFFFPTGGEGK